MQAAFEEHAGQLARAPQSVVLRYFLRVDPDYGATQVSAALNARKMTGCFRFLLQEFGAELPKVEQAAIGALDDSDPELVQDAVRALSRWESADVEKALWTRLERFHQEWTGRGNQLRPPEKLARLTGLVFSKGQKDQNRRLDEAMEARACVDETHLVS
jgi:hypothetical protein